MMIYVLQKIDYVSGTSGVSCVYQDREECVRFLEVCGWKKTDTINMYTHDDLHCHVIIHEKVLIESGLNQHLLPN